MSIVVLNMFVLLFSFGVRNWVLSWWLKMCFLIDFIFFVYKLGILFRLLFSMIIFGLRVLMMEVMFLLKKWMRWLRVVFVCILVFICFRMFLSLFFWLDLFLQNCCSVGLEIIVFMQFVCLQQYFFFEKLRKLWLYFLVMFCWLLCICLLMIRLLFMFVFMMILNIICVFGVLWGILFRWVFVIVK